MKSRKETLRTLLDSKWVWVIALLSLIPCLPSSIQLYRQINTDFGALLPKHAPSVIDLEAASQRIATTEHLAILIQSADRESTTTFTRALRHELQRRKTIHAAQNKIGTVTEGIFQEESRSLEIRNARRLALLSLPLSDLIDLKNDLKKRIQYEKELYNPLNIFSEVELEEPPAWTQWESRITQQLSPTGISLQRADFSSADGKTRALLVGLNAPASDIQSMLTLKREVEEAARITRATLSHLDPSTQLHYTGGVQNALDEHAGIIEDLGKTGVLVLVLVVASLFLLMRDLPLVLSILASLMVAIVWTFGIASFWVTRLNSNSAFLGSIILGNGINYGIILGFRFLYLERTRATLAPTLSTLLHQSRSETWRPTLFAACTAGVAYGSLLFTQFEGFKQFGGIGLLGVLLSWASAMILVPPLVLLLKKTPPRLHNLEIPRASIQITGPMARSQRRRASTLVLIISLLITGFSVQKLIQTDWSRLLETNLTRLRSERSFESGSGFWGKTLDTLLGRGLSPVGILSQSREQANAIIQNIQNEHPALASGIIRLPPLFFEKENLIQAKQEILSELHQIFPPWKLARLNGKDRTRLAPLLDPALIQPNVNTQFKLWLPNQVRNLFTEKNGEFGRIFWINPPRASRDYSPTEIDRWVSTLRQSVQGIDPQGAVVGTLPLTRDLLMGVQTDAPRSALLSALGVCLLILFLSFKAPRRAIALFSCVVFGITWLGGWLILSNQKLHFLNFLAIPITLGIGVDYGINFLETLARQRGNKNPLEIQFSGKAVFLCSATTLIGYGSLLVADNRALRSFGWICVVGELTCLIAALVTLPAIWNLLTLSDERVKPWKLRSARRSGQQPSRKESPKLYQKHSDD
jgi:predicted RND superfamily exporter protein